MPADSSALRAYAARMARAGAKAQRLAEAAVAKTTLDVTTDAVILAPVDTGFLMSSATHEVNGLTGTVSFTANYAVHVEEGTSRMQGRHFLGQALERRKEPFNKAVSQIVRLASA